MNSSFTEIYRVGTLLILNILSEKELKFDILENNGLNETDTYYILRGTISPSYTSLLFKEPTYLSMHIKELPNYKSCNKNNSDAYAIIPLNKDIQNYKVELRPPMPYLDRLTIKFVNYDGEVYDFSGMEHYFILAIKYLEHS